MPSMEPDDHGRGDRRSLFWLLASHAALAAVLVTMWARRQAPSESALYWDDASRREVQAIVEDRYLEPVDADRARDLFHAALDGYVHRLDPFSRYFSPEERLRLEEDTRGSFGGIGVRIVRERGGLRVTAVKLDGPAARVGIRPGDLLVAADGVPLADQDISELVERIKGKPGSTLELALEGTDGEAREVSVTRRLVDLETVPAVRFFDEEVPIVYLRVSQFADSTPDELARALGKGLDHDPDALVLDLRRNPGGVVRAAVEVAGFFLPPRTLVCTTHGRGSEGRYLTPEESVTAARDLPLAVLVDEKTASAGELLAGALQDHGRAVLIGTSTYGKFLVQTILPLARSDGAVRVTTSRYETPLGRSAQRNVDRGVRGGLTPDVRVLFDRIEQQEELALAFDRQLGPEWEGLAEDREPASLVDAQLLVALRLLRSEGVPPEYVPAATR